MLGHAQQRITSYLSTSHTITWRLARFLPTYWFDAGRQEATNAATQTVYCAHGCGWLDWAYRLRWGGSAINADAGKFGRCGPEQEYKPGFSRDQARASFAKRLPPRDASFSFPHSCRGHLASQSS